MTLKNNITQKLQIQYPVIQAPMLGVSTPAMAAEISKTGGLGSLPVGGLSPEATIELIRKTKSLTDKPFAVNLFVHEVPSYEESAIELMRQFIINLAKKRGYPLTENDLSDFKFYNYRDQLEILIKENIRIISFTFGCLDKKSIEYLKTNDCILIGTATCVEEAMILKEHGIDLITAQGIEAGGHRGTFIESTSLPQVGLFALLPQIIKQTQLPVIAAGGINSPATIKAAFELDAEAVQIGSAFIDSEESEAIESYRHLLVKAKDTDTVLTRAISGRWARGFKNELIKAIENSGLAIPPYPVQNSFTTKLRKLAQQANDHEYTTLWAGQSSNSTETKKSRDIFERLLQGII